VTAARVARTGAVAAAVVAAVATVLTAVLKPDAFDAFCHVGLATCTPQAEPAPSTPAIPVGKDESTAGKSGNGPNISFYGGNSSVTGSGNSTANSSVTGSGNSAGKTGGRKTGSAKTGGKNIGKAGTGKTGTGSGGATDQPEPPPPASPAPAPTETPRPGARVHGGPSPVHVGWQPDSSTDIDDIGFRSGPDYQDGQVRATEAGLQSVGGVRMIRIHGEADVSYARCEAPAYKDMTRSIGAAKIQVDDYICADDGAQYLAVFRIDGLPGPGKPYYEMTGTSYARY
jgi:hypothetical protein